MKATISINNGNLAPKDGIVTIMWWKGGSVPNQELVSTKPIWEVLNSREVFLLCAIGEVIEVDTKLVSKMFKPTEI